MFLMRGLSTQAPLGRQRRADVSGWLAQQARSQVPLSGQAARDPAGQHCTATQLPVKHRRAEFLSLFRFCSLPQRPPYRSSAAWILPSHTPTSPCQRASNYIRVLDLLPAEHMESPIQLELRAVPVQRPMASEDTYEALSYVWGTGGAAGLVYCGGKVIGITANCLTALTYLRRRRKVRTLWVDAICNNQAGPIEEKNHQVALMSEVYTGASKVLIWLGDKKDRLWWLMRLCDRRSWWLGPLPWYFDRGMYHSVCCNFPPGWHHMSDETIVSKSTRARNFYLHPAGVFLSCLGSPYFTRAWTLQEMILAAKAEFVCRHAVLPWHKDLGIYLFDEAGEYTVVFRHLFLSFAGRIGGPSPSWKEIGRFYAIITETMAGRRCLRPHDKLFATYGLLHALGYPPPPLDYDQDFLVPWEGFCRHRLVATRSLMYLVYQDLPRSCSYLVHFQPKC